MPSASGANGVTPPSPLRPPRELLVAWTLLLLKDDPLHGYGLHRALRHRGLAVDARTLYRWLGKFERDCWVGSRWAQSADGPRRHVYVLTDDGRGALHEVSRRIAGLRDAHSAFLHGYDEALAVRGDARTANDGGAKHVRPAQDAPAGDAQTTTDAVERLRPHKELLAGWLLLHLDAGATYGYGVHRALAANGLSVDPAVMYRMLRRLETDEWAQSRWLSPAGGPARRSYRLTARGRRNLDEVAVVLGAMRYLHDAYLGEYEQAHRLE